MASHRRVEIMIKKLDGKVSSFPEAWMPLGVPSRSATEVVAPIWREKNTHK